ncbi:MAG: hypothetical protein JXR07_20205 [Reichenbachiella sp.]
MIRYIQLAFTFSILSCSSNNENLLSEWELYNTEVIEYSQQGNKKIQTIYSTRNTQTLGSSDSSVIIQHFKDTLLVEKVQYNLEHGDSIKWLHVINRYNTDRLLIERIDSLDGSFFHQSLYSYLNGQLLRSEFLAIVPTYNKAKELINTDTTRTVVHSYYNDNGKCIKVMALVKNELLTKNTRTIKFDTTLTFIEVDKNGNDIQAVSTSKGDTTSLTKTEYDEFNRKVKFIETSLQFGTNTLKYEYDDNGNRTSELLNSDGFNELIITDFDEQNRPINRNTYRPKTLANIR